MEIVDENVKKSIIIIPTLHDLQNIKNNINDYKKLYWYKEITKLSKLHNTKIIDLADVQLHHKNKKVYLINVMDIGIRKGSNYAANLYFNKINSSN